MARATPGDVERRLAHSEDEGRTHTCGEQRAAVFTGYDGDAVRADYLKKGDGDGV